MKDAGARSSTSRCRTRNTRCRPITSWRRPKPRPTSPAMTACATACACRARTSSTCTSRPAPQASAARSSAACMIGTYVLSAGYYDAYYLQGAEGAHADQARFRERVRQRHRRDPDAGHAVGRLRHRRPGHERRPGEDVSQRRLHRHRQHGRPAGHLGARRPRRPGACRSACSSSAGPSTRRCCSAPPMSSSRLPGGSSRRSGGRSALRGGLG